MEFMIISGLLAMIASFYFGVPELKTDYALYLEPNSFTLVFGGTIASTMLSSSFKDFKTIFKVFKGLLIKTKVMAPIDAVNLLVQISEKAQGASKQALADEGKGKGDGFLDRSLGMVAAGLDKDFIRRTLETDIAEIQRRHSVVVNMIRTMGSYAPMFGMTGTVMGVTQVLKNVTDISNIVQGMSLALLTTLYGLILSSVIFIPISNKLKAQTVKEVLSKEIILEGIMMILDKEIPLKVQKYLTAFLESSEKQDGKKNNPPPVDDGDDGSAEIGTVYGDMVTFIMVLFILLFVLSYNEKQDNTFFTQMRLQFGGPKIEQEDVLTAESLFISQVQGYIKKHRLSDYAQVLVDEQRIQLMLNHPVLFDSGKAKNKKRWNKSSKRVWNINQKCQEPDHCRRPYR